MKIAVHLPKLSWKLKWPSFSDTRCSVEGCSLLGYSTGTLTLALTLTITQEIIIGAGLPVE